MSESDLIPLEPILSRIVVLRGVRVMLDADLAQLYGVPTKRLLEQVRRNPARFPEDFCFQIDRHEFAHMRSQNATASRRNVRFLPFAFTEHGAIQAANVLNSDTAVEMSVQVVRAFLRLRQLFVNHKALAAKLDALDARVGAHDQQIAALIEAIRRLTAPDGPRHRRRIGFRGNSAAGVEESATPYRRSPPRSRTSRLQPTS